MTMRWAERVERTGKKKIFLKVFVELRAREGGK